MGDTMLLNNYVLQSTKNSKFGVGNTLTIPSLAIKGISLQDLMDKKAAVREIRMDNPQLVVFSGSKKGSGKLELNSNTFREIRPFVDVDRVVLNNAKVTVRDRKDKDNKLGTENFSAVIMSRSALAAKDAEGILSSVTQVNMEHFFFITPKVQLEMFGGKIDYKAKTLHFNSVEGSLNNHKIQAKLNDVMLQGSPDLRPFRKDEVWQISGISAGSGTLDINVEDKPAVKSDEENKLLSSIDLMNLSNITVTFHKGPLAGSAMVKSFEAEGQESYTNGYRWGKFTGQLEKVNIKNDKFALESDAADLSSSGKTSLRNARISFNGGNTNFTAAAPEMELSSEFHSFEPGNILIDFLKMSKPVIRLELKKDSAVASAPDSVSKDFTLKDFVLDDPDIVVDIAQSQ